MEIRVSFGKALKAKTLLIVRLQGFIRFVSHLCDPAGIQLLEVITPDYQCFASVAQC